MSLPADSSFSRSLPINSTHSNSAMLSQMHMPNIHRRGFTLIELMIAIVIIAILAGLLLPALNSVMRNARDTKVRAEITQLESGIAAFRARFGVEPPSQISIFLSGAGWAGSPRDRSIIRQIWPQFDFTMPTGSYPAWWSNANTLGANGAINMNSGECLVFFLGGIPTFANITSGTSWDITQPMAPTGFSKNPSQPFALGGNREGPFFEFVPGRWTDIDVPHNNMPEYRDSLPGQTQPYLYYSSYDGVGYRNTLTTNPTTPGELSTLTIGNVYLDAAGTWYKPRSFQIISPGVDTLYGSGGIYNPNTANAGLSSADDYDNITNFSSGRLFAR